MLKFEEKKFSQVAVWTEGGDESTKVSIRINQETESGPVISFDTGYVMLDGVHAGTFYVTISNGELNVAFNQIPFDKIVQVSTAVMAAISEIKSQITLAETKQ